MALECGCCHLGNGDWVIDSAHKYFAQVQGQLGSIEIEECNSAIFTTTGLGYTVSQLNLINLMT